MPHSAAPKLKEFARRLLSFERESAEAGDSGAAFRVCEQLGQRLSKLMGAGGFKALLTRALALASAEIPWLGSFHVEPDGSLGGLAAITTKTDPKEVARGEVALVAQLLTLLVTFIGPALTLSLIREVWPNEAFDETSLAEGETL